MSERGGNSSPLAGEVAPKGSEGGGAGSGSGVAGGATPTPSPSPQGGGGLLSGRLVGDTHILPVRVYYEDTDFSGLVYHASYLRFLERGRTEFLRSVGVDQSALHAGAQPLVFAVRRMTIDWLKPARMDDIIEVETRTHAIRGASLDVHQTIRRGPDVLVTAQVLVAAIAGGRPARIPDALRVILDGPKRERRR